MGFKTVKEAFRAALTGRISSRKNGGVDLEDRVISTGCTALGHPNLTRADIKNFQPSAREETVADAIFRLNGGQVSIPEELLSISTRKILLPSAMHNAIAQTGISTLGELLAAKLTDILKNEGIRKMNLGLFLAHIFDYVFILHEQENPGGGFDPNSIQDSSSGRTETEPFSGFDSWPGKDAQQSGDKLLKNNKLEFFMFFRNTVGAVFREDSKRGIAYLSLADNQEIVSADCKLCPVGSSKPAGQCPHTAALVLKMIRNNEEQDQTPITIKFNKGPWFVIGQIVYELFGRDEGLDVDIKELREGWFIKIPGIDAKPWAAWRIDRETMTLARALFGSHLKWLDNQISQELPPEIPYLWETLIMLGRTKAEVDLNSFDKRSTAQDRDESIWMWLAARLCQNITAKNMQITGPGEDNLFSLTATTPDTGEEIFRMIIPRAKTPDMVDALHRDGNLLLKKESASAITQIDLAENGDLTFTPLIKLADGRTFNRHDLKSSCYGHYYYLENEGFISVIEQDPAHAIKSNNEQKPVTFHANKVPESLNRYHEIVTAPENRTTPDLEELDFLEMPDRLEIGSFSADDDWCYLSGRYGLGSRNISLAELLSARIEKKKFITGGEKWLKLTDSPLEWFHNLGEERLWRDENNNSKGVRLTKRELIMLSAMMPGFSINETTKGYDQLQKLLDTDRWQEEYKPQHLPSHLRGYQKHGISWLYHLYRNGLAGILADDMGLGKTHQALGLLQAIIAENKKVKFLIVCPATVVPHWVEKIEKYFPSLSHYVYHGSRRDLDKTGGENIYITTYGIIRRDTETLASLNFEVIFFDEIQNLKNRKTDVYKAADRLNGRIIIGMTGTPLENSIYDLKAIFDICLPGYLGNNRDFKAKYIEPFETDDRDHAKESLVKLINPFVLRRSREQVLTELPEIIEDIRTCELSDDQIGLYRDLTGGKVRSIMQMLSSDQDESGLPYLELLAIINYLKQICDHPCLLKKCTDPSSFKSGKWDLFVELLNECLESGIKVVVFSHYTRMLDLIENYLKTREIPFCGLRGNMSMGVRHEMIKKFNNDDDYRVFTASLLAGGVGVDLTAAQAVIHYDRWWNAAREDQATARVHRMGQKNVVQVFKLITLGTLEEKINRLIAKKKDLANHLVRQDDAAIIKKLNREELLELLSEPAGRGPVDN